MDKSSDVQRWVAAYNFGQNTLCWMGVGDGWKVISKEDIHLSSEVAEANREKLPWFWRIKEGEEGTAVELESSKRMEECELEYCSLT